MASIEIDSNTIIKLLARRGSDLERKSTILAEGEFGYAVDTKRLYIGDGFTPGMIPTSIRFHNTTTDITNIGETVQLNDLVYKSDTNEIYKLVSGTGSSLSDWELISSPKYISTDGSTLSATPAGELFVREISGQHISPNALGEGIEKVFDRISLSGSIAIDSINLKSSNTLTLPSAITFSNDVTLQSFIFPTEPGNDKYHLVTNGFGNLSWEAAAQVEVGTVFMADAAAPVGSVIFYAASSFTEPVGWLICDGRSLSGVDYPELSAAIGTVYGGGDGPGEFNLPNYMDGGMLYGVQRGVEDIGNVFPVLTGATLNVFLTGTALTGLSATLSADQTFNTDTPLNAYAGIWLIKYKVDNPITTQINVLTSEGLSAYNVTNSQPTTAITLSGIYNLTIPTGDIGSGNPAIVSAYRKARTPQMYTYTASGEDVYTVSDNVYRIKVTATGPGGVGYIRYDSNLWRANGTQGGAGSSIVAYIDVEPGEVYRVYVGGRGTAVRSPDPVTETEGLTAGWGEDTSFSLSAGPASITSILIARGAYDEVATLSATSYNADWSGGGAARGGIKGGEVYLATHAKVVSYYNVKGGDGGQFMENGPEGPGAASMWGSGPAPGGGGSGHARKDFIGVEVAQAGDGIVIVEEL
jgi:microcystin-dependent protein